MKDLFPADKTMGGELACLLTQGQHPGLSLGLGCHSMTFSGVNSGSKMKGHFNGEAGQECSRELVEEGGAAGPTRGLSETPGGRGWRGLTCFAPT